MNWENWPLLTLVENYAVVFSLRFFWPLWIAVAKRLQFFLFCFAAKCLGNLGAPQFSFKLQAQKKIKKDVVI